MYEITVFDGIDEEVEVLPSFLKDLLEFSAYYHEILENIVGIAQKYQEIPGNISKYLLKS
jgi:hypothetical protein